MMDDVLKQIEAGEVSGVQFKERILDKYDIACELVAFSNSHGGKLVVGIKDKTGIRPDGTLTVAAMLLFGKYTQRWMPMMTAKCICFAGVTKLNQKVTKSKT